MSFWEEISSGVHDRTTTGDVSADLFSSIKASGIAGVAVVQPTYYLGRFYILCFDYMDFIQKLLDCPDDVDEIFQKILYLREITGTMGRCIKNAAEPIEGMMSLLDVIYEHSLEQYEEDDIEEEDEHVCGEGCSCGCEDSEEEQEFVTERDEMTSAIAAKLEAANVSDVVARSLAVRMADAYCGCVCYIRSLKALHSLVPSEDLSLLMGALLEIQYVMDTKLRRLLLEDVFLDATPPFTTGLIPWMSHAIEELARQINYSNLPKVDEDGELI